jgi:hypothetical protein
MFGETVGERWGGGKEIGSVEKGNGRERGLVRGDRRRKKGTKKALFAMKRAF